MRAAVGDGITGADLNDVVVPLPSLQPDEQVSIYRDGWFWRLRDCLRDDFPAVAHIMGEERWERLVRDYLEVHRPRTPNIADIGDRLVDWLGTRTDLPDHAFLVDLARLEWTVCTTFVHPDGPRLQPDDVEGIDPERFLSARFTPAATTAILDFDYPVNDVIESLREDGSPGVPEPAPQAVLVSRTETRLRRRAIDGSQRLLLERLLAGEPLGDAMMAVVGEDPANAEAVAASVTEWFTDWVAGGVFEGVAYED